MATKITALTELTVPISTDILAIVDDPAGTAVTKKVTLANLMANAGAVTATSLTAADVYGSSSSGGTLTLHSTSHATKGKILFGSNSVYDEVNDRWGFGTTGPLTSLDVHINQNNASQARVRNDTSGTLAQSSVSTTFGHWTQYITMQQLSPSFATSGLRVANSAGLFSSGNVSGLRIYTIDASNLILGTSDTARMTITSTGKVIINGTSASGQLTVNAADATTVGLVVDNYASTTANIAEFKVDGTDKLKVSKEGILDFTGTMGNSSKTVGTDAPADWVEVEIGGTTYYLPAYAA